MIISVEGIDGAGKTTLVKALEKALKEKGIEVEVFREPGTTAVGEKIREILKNTELDPLTELLLFEASRRELFVKVLRHVPKEKVILIDRFYDSSTAYQGYGKGIEISLIEFLNERTTEGLKPDLTILIDIDPETALSRIGKKDRFEDREFLEKVREGFLKIAEKEKGRFFTIEGHRSKEEIRDLAVEKIIELLGSIS